MIRIQLSFVGEIVDSKDKSEIYCLLTYGVLNVQVKVCLQFVAILFITPPCCFPCLPFLNQFSRHLSHLSAKIFRYLCSWTKYKCANRSQSRCFGGGEGGTAGGIFLYVQSLLYTHFEQHQYWVLAALIHLFLCNILHFKRFL